MDNETIRIIKNPKISPWDMDSVHQWMRAFTNMSPETISKTPPDRLMDIASGLWEEMREKKAHRMNWYKIAQLNWEDFQWHQPGFNYKQCYNCGIFFLPDKTFAYPPSISPQKNMKSTLNSIDSETKAQYQINKETVSHGICPKCFMKQMQEDLGVSQEEAENALCDSGYSQNWESLYHNK